jgi:hypothetical protein
MNTQEFIKNNTWRAHMDKSQGLDGWGNYSGGMERADWVVVPVGRNRNSEILQESNFDVALERLGGESKNVEIHRFGHWGCGWFELILVNPKSKKHVKIALEIKNDLDDYPVLDDSDFSEREREYQSNYAKDAQDDLSAALAKHLGLKDTKALKDIAYNLNMECQNYYGNDSCINVYSMREPDKRDLEQVKTCMEQMQYNYQNSKVFRKLYTAVLGRITTAKE